MKIRYVSVTVNDQARALEFYTNVLGFVKHVDVAMGGDTRWLSVIEPGNPNVELLLEPIGFPPAAIYQRALFDAGIPVTALVSADLAADYRRIALLGAVFRGEPTRQGPVLVAVLEDTCGNLVQLIQPV